MIKVSAVLVLLYKIKLKPSVQENQQLKEIVNKLRLEKEILLDMLAEVTAELKINT